MATSTVKIYGNVLRKLSQAQITALKQTAEHLHTEVVQAQVMPFRDGTLQGPSTFIDDTDLQKGAMSLVSDTTKAPKQDSAEQASDTVETSGSVSHESHTSYARRLYFHPEYNFDKTKNPNAKGRWLEDWVTGDKKNFCKDAYAKIYKALTGV